MTVRGEVVVPGDKSTTHRALILGALASGTTTVSGALDSADTRASASIAAALGADVRWDADRDVEVVGRGEAAPLRSGTHDDPLVLDCGNAGTAARLWLGVLAGRDGHWRLDGDASLRRRPMARVTGPLAAAGARVSGDRLPLDVHGAALRGVRHVVELPSAQVKSALLLAGLVADGPTTVVQPVPTRDHTERLLPRFGVRCEVDPGAATVHPDAPVAAQLDVPGDPSGAAFFCVLGAIVPGAELLLPDVGLWPRRIGFLAALDRAAADVSVVARERSRSATLGGTALTDRPARASVDPVGALRAAHSPDLAAFDITPRDVPDLVDEVPILAVAAACARGTSRFAGLDELRVKESDRVATVAALLASFGAQVDLGDDELVIRGAGREALSLPSRLEAHDDHRLAMCQAVLALAVAPPPDRAALLDALDLRAAAVSYPGFADELRRLVGSTRDPHAEA